MYMFGRPSAGPWTDSSRNGTLIDFEWYWPSVGTVIAHVEHQTGHCRCPFPGHISLVVFFSHREDSNLNRLHQLPAAG